MAAPPETPAGAPDMGPRVLVIVPTFNEEACIAEVISSVHQHVPYADVLVVNDGSTDDTAHRARQAGGVVLSLPFNLGVGAAIRAGYKYARNSGYRKVVQMDGDGQHDASYIPNLIAGLDTADLIIGARFSGEGNYHAPTTRRLAMRILSLLLTILLRAKLNDVTSGFRACGPRALSVFCQHYPAEYLGDTVESLIIARKASLRIRQIPVSMRPRQNGQASQDTVHSCVYFARAILAVALGLVRKWPLSIEEAR